MENSHKLSKPHWNNPMWLVCGDGKHRSENEKHINRQIENTSK